MASGQKRLEITGQGANSLAFSPDGRTLASERCLWDVTDGQQLRLFDGPVSDCVAFAPNGKEVATANRDGTVLIWDVDVLAHALAPQAMDQAPDALERRWAELEGEDAVKAYQALSALVADPRRSVPWLAKHLHPATSTMDRARFDRLIADLDDDRFEVREQASRGLKEMGERIVPALVEVLRRDLSAEAQRRAKVVLTQLGKAHVAVPTGKDLRDLRAVEILEKIGSPQARALLAALARGTPEARMTQEVKASLQRLERRIPRP
jgi:hypothetical protein